MISLQPSLPSPRGSASVGSQFAAPGWRFEAVPGETALSHSNLLGESRARGLSSLPARTEGPRSSEPPLSLAALSLCRAGNKARVSARCGCRGSCQLLFSLPASHLLGHLQMMRPRSHPGDFPGQHQPWDLGIGWDTARAGGCRSLGTCPGQSLTKASPLRQGQPGEKQGLLFVPDISLTKLCFSAKVPVAGGKQGLNKENSLSLTANPLSRWHLKPHWRRPQTPPDSALGLSAPLTIFPFLFPFCSSSSYKNTIILFLLLN